VKESSALRQFPDLQDTSWTSYLHFFSRSGEIRCCHALQQQGRTHFYTEMMRPRFFIKL